MQKSIALVTFSLLLFAGTVGAEIHSNIKALLGPKELHFGDWDKGYIKAKGTWIMKNAAIDNPTQATEIHCYKNRKICTEAVAYLSPHGLLSVATALYDIDHWNAAEIVTKPLKSTPCTHDVKKFTRAHYRVTGVRSTLSHNHDCVGVDTKELSFELVDGFDLLLNSFEQEEHANQHTPHRP